MKVWFANDDAAGAFCEEAEGCYLHCGLGPMHPVSDAPAYLALMEATLPQRRDRAAGYEIDVADEFRRQVERVIDGVIENWDGQFRREIEIVAVPR